MQSVVGSQEERVVGLPSSLLIWRRACLSCGLQSSESAGGKARAMSRRMLKCDIFARILIEGILPANLKLASRTSKFLEEWRCHALPKGLCCIPAFFTSGSTLQCRPLSSASSSAGAVGGWEPGGKSGRVAKLFLDLEECLLVLWVA
ncbi:hypothetical protein E2542_SST16663 [Spatholobus suberectus]|nr:hypothetical protein E2542_SST16663 [Spatholobus suberectus]